MTESILPTVLLSAWFWMLWPISFLASTCADGIGVVAVVRGAGVVVLVWAKAGAARAKATALVSATFLNITCLQMSDCAPASREHPTAERVGGNPCSIKLLSFQPSDPGSPPGVIADRTGS